MEPHSDLTVSTQAKILGAQLTNAIRRYQNRATFGIVGIPACSALLFMLITLLQLTRFDSLFFYLPALAIWLGVTGSMMSRYMRPQPEYRQIVQALADLEDVHAIAPLIDTLQIDHAVVHEITVPALIALLPQLRSNETDLLNTEQRARLGRILSGPLPESRRERAVTLRVAILQAFTQIGDSRIRPEVEAWVRRKPQIPDRQQIHDAALICLDALKLRAEQQNSAQTLLRASIATASPDTLLRPTTGIQETPPEQLLRPGSPAP